MERIKLMVPASCANLGSAFDVLGIAVNLYNVFEFSLSDKDAFICEGKYCSLVNPEKVFQKLDSLSEILGIERPPITLKEVIEIPLSSGLGSSASFVVASIFALNELLDLKFDEGKILNAASLSEGHPDNVAAALFGGCVMLKKRPEGVFWKKLPWPHKWKIVVYLPASSVSTDDSRKILPVAYSRDTVVDQISSAGFLVSGILMEDIEMLKIGMEDRMHQQYRFLISPESKRVFETLKFSTDAAVFLSGSGPAVGVVCESSDELPDIAGAHKMELSVSEGVMFS
ncbi:MAG: homoserine kinase [Thermotogota bacterium]|nr:homoserine kinase [Thermotogota bacterium]